MTMETLTCSWVEHLAKISALPGDGPGSPESAEALHTLSSILFDESGRDGLFGKTFPACLVETHDADSLTSCEPCPTAGIHAGGEFWTLPVSDTPSDASECSLLDVLQETGDIPQRYYLTVSELANLLADRCKHPKSLRIVWRRPDLEGVCRVTGTPTLESQAGLECSRSKNVKD
jgi:hypothetical protein